MAQAYEFGEFRLEPTRRRLVRTGSTVAITPKVFDTLLYLVEHRGTVLSKDDMLAALWPDVAVEENNLGQAISKLRSALGEAPGENRYVVTVPGHGYRFAAEVRTVDDPSAHEGERVPPPAAATMAETLPSGRTAPSDPPRSPHLRSRPERLALRYWVAVPLVVVSIGLVILYAWGTRSGAGTSGSVATIAVLPFKPLVQESQNEALQLGMAVSLIAKLSTLQQLTLRPLGTVRRYTDPNQDPVAAGHELGVDAVLDGQIYKAGNRVRVTARLVRVADQKQLWAGQYDEEFTSIFDIQDAIAHQVTRELSLELSLSEQQALVRRHTNDPAAYEMYLKGRFFMSLAQPRNAIQLFEQAISRDPEFALAHAGLADIYSRLPIATDGSSREAIGRATSAALKALALDDRLGEAYAALGWIGFYYDWNWAESERNYRQALQINERDFSARLGYAHLLSNTFRHDEALREIDSALAMDPLSPIAATLKGQFLFHAGRYDEAREQLRQTVASNPAFWIAQVQSGHISLRDKLYDEAVAAFTRARQSGGALTPAALIGYTHGVAGRREEAVRVLRELMSVSPETYVPPYHVALVHHGLGDRFETLKWLERGYQEKDVRMVFLGVDPLWDSLRDDTRFAVLLKRLNLAQ